MMNTVLQGLQGVWCYIDDILVSGKDEASHFKQLEKVFSQLEKHGSDLNRRNVDSCYLE